MAKQRIGTVARAARAALKEALGKVTGNRGLEAEGAAEKAALTLHLPAAEKAALTPRPRAHGRRAPG